MKFLASGGPPIKKNPNSLNLDAGSSDRLLNHSNVLRGLVAAHDRFPTGAGAVANSVAESNFFTALLTSPRQHRPDGFFTSHAQ